MCVTSLQVPLKPSHYCLEHERKLRIIRKAAASDHTLP